VFRLWDWGKERVSNQGSFRTDHKGEDELSPGSQKGKSNRVAKISAILIGLVVLIATAFYAYSFSNIYTRPITRVEASRWIYQNIPGPITLPIRGGDQQFNQQVQYPYNFVTSPEIPFKTKFRAKQSGELSEIHLGKIIDPNFNFGIKSFRVKVGEFPGGGSETLNLEIDFSIGEVGDIGTAVSTYNQPVQVTNNNQYFASITLPPGQGPLKINGSLDIIIQGDQAFSESNPLVDVLVDSINPHVVSFSPQQDGIITEIALNVLLPNEPLEKTVVLSISDQPDSEEILAAASLSGNFEGGVDPKGNQVSLSDPIDLEEGNDYYLTISVESAQGEILIRGTPIANEGAWDDGLPVRIDGYDGFAGIYEPGLNFDMYEDDNPNKLTRFYDILDHSEYLLISSSRQWGTLPRLPERFPMNSAYYRHLLGCPSDKSIEWCYNSVEVGDFKGDLGYELVSVFQSDPGIAQLNLNDQGSEEAFTVYDHPKVLIFRKTPDYDPENVRQILGGVDLSNVVHITPKKAGAVPRDMMLPYNRLISQLAGGTWSQIFNVDSLLNRWPVVGTIVWYLAVALLGIIAYPIIRLALPGLADHGYPLSRVAGLLFLSFSVWIAGSINIPFTRTTISIVLFLILVVSGILVYLQRADLRQELRDRRRYILMVEGLFLAFFVFDLLIRLGNPDLWHPWKGGEKPMDFSYLNAVLKSTTFPPFDPWFSGGYINYYYYGFAFVGVLVKWLGIVPSVAYNMIIPTIFSMIAMGAFSIGWNVVSAGRSAIRTHSSWLRSIPFISGISAAIGMAVLGNLGTVRMIYLGYQRLAAPGGDIEGANIIMRLFWAIQGALMTLTGASLPYGIADWYWLPSRVIPAPNDVEPITEFPFFTVLYGDPHAHLFALPLALFALTWGFSIIFSKGWRNNPQDSKEHSYLRIGLSLLVGGLAIGALRPTNTWDFPIYLALGLLAVGYSVWMYNRPDISSSTMLTGGTPRLKRFMITVVAMLAIGILALLLYQPYLNWYVQGYTDISFWRGTHTPFLSYLTHWGVFLFVIISWLIWETRDWMSKTPLSELRKLSPHKGWIIGGGVLSLIWIITLMVIDISIAWFVIPVIIWIAVLIFRPHLSDAKRAVLVLIAAGLAMTLMVEIIVLVGDIGRMNTVFKFYLQVWTLLAISAGVAFAWTLETLTTWLPPWRTLWQVIVIFLVASAGLYPLLGGTAKIKDRMTEDVSITMDGMAFMKSAEYDDLGTRMELSQDFQAIRWLQDNVIGSPVIIEGHMVEYHWGTRITTYTGLPGVIGWNNHQRQQRARAPENTISDRITDVNEFYNTSDPERAVGILDDYGVKYIILGQLERALYPGSGLEKFESFNGELWQEVFRTGDTVIYQIIS
jgi:YYY domain-containing protein